MITLEVLNNGRNIQIDLPEDTIWQWDSHLFAGGLRKAWSTDMDIPKTLENCKALGISSIISDEIPIKSGILHQLGMDIVVEIAINSIDDETMNITLYEKCLDDKLLDKDIKDFFKDDQTTIIPWWRSSHVEYRNPNPYNQYEMAIRPYYYGVDHFPKACQWHPSMNLRKMITKINLQGNYQLPLPPSDWMAISTRKRVCPENRVQVVEINQSGTKKTGLSYKFRGGQHVTNDLNLGLTEEVTFNRPSRMQVRLFISYHSNPNAQGYAPDNAAMKLTFKYSEDSGSDIPELNYYIGIPSHTWDCNVWYDDFVLDTHHGNGKGALSMECISNWVPEMFSCVAYSQQWCTRWDLNPHTLRH